MNYHLHVLVTEGGMNQAGKWQAQSFLNYKQLRRVWQYEVLTRVRREMAETLEREQLINELFTRYSQGFYVYAEYVAVPQDVLAQKPEDVTFAEAASVPTSGYIALMNLNDGGQVQPGPRVLINGAGGGVGSIALQLAKAYGAHVTGQLTPVIDRSYPLNRVAEALRYLQAGNNLGKIIITP